MNENYEAPLLRILADAIEVRGDAESDIADMKGVVANGGTVTVELTDTLLILVNDTRQRANRAITEAAEDYLNRNMSAVLDLARDRLDRAVSRARIELEQARNAHEG